LFFFKNKIKKFDDIKVVPLLVHVLKVICLKTTKLWYLQKFKEKLQPLFLKVSYKKNKLKNIQFKIIKWYHTLGMYTIEEEILTVEYEN